MNKTALNSQKEKHSMLSLRRATGRHTSQKDPQFISIHALLAESDENNDSDPYRGCNFYPRSPCGERRFCVYLFKFQPLISIHALLAESDFAMVIEVETSDGFLSTLSLRRATVCLSLLRWHSLNFYPRSPCGERLTLMHAAQAGNAISIHALLAESDASSRPAARLGRISIHALLAESDIMRKCAELQLIISIHALLAESDRQTPGEMVCGQNFYPRSPCGERPCCPATAPRANFYFYPRSPCGERRGKHRAKWFVAKISIHALLAESDRLKSPRPLPD